jgi:hypothetical protein
MSFPLLHARVCSLVCLVALAGGCASDGEPGAGHAPDAGPGEVSDAARTADAAMTLDAAGSLDAAREAGTDDGSTSDGSACGASALASCPSTGVVSVSCGDLVCSGATPVCCLHAHETPTLGPSCVSLDTSCRGSADVTNNYTNRCDDARDCAAGEICRDGFNKGLNRLNGARCELACGASWAFGIFQLCSQDCECGPGKRCSNLRCEPTP